MQTTLKSENEFVHNTQATPISVQNAQNKTTRKSVTLYKMRICKLH